VASITLTKATQSSFNGKRASAARWRDLDRHYRHFMKSRG